MYMMPMSQPQFPSSSASFDLTDPAERFMSDVIQRFHANGSMPRRVLATRRVDVSQDGRRHRLVLQAVRFQPQRHGAKPVWDLLVWDIDEPGVRFLSRPTRIAMLELYHSLHANDPAPAG
jgi:hypothetical protein